MVSHTLTSTGNWEERDELCLLEEGLRRAADEGASAGWSFVNEGTAEKRKFGWVVHGNLCGCCVAVCCVVQLQGVLLEAQALGACSEPC